MLRLNKICCLIRESHLWHIVIIQGMPNDISPNYFYPCTWSINMNEKFIKRFHCDLYHNSLLGHVFGESFEAVFNFFAKKLCFHLRYWGYGMDTKNKYVGAVPDKKRYGVRGRWQNENMGMGSLYSSHELWTFCGRTVSCKRLNSLKYYMM